MPTQRKVTLLLERENCPAPPTGNRFDSFGQRANQKPGPLGRTRGYVKPLRGAEGERARRLYATASHEIEMPYVPGFDAGCRATLTDGRVLNCLGPPIDVNQNRRKMRWWGVMEG